jgi:hypothetical protein
MNISSFLKVSPQELLKRLTARKDLVLGAVVVACGIIFAGILYNKQQQRLKVIEAEIAQQEQKVVLAKELSALDDKLKVASSAYARKDGSFTINKFSELAAAAGAKIVSLSVESEADSGLYTITSYRLSVKADYHSLGRFISALESAGDMVKVEEVSLTLVGVQARAYQPEEAGKANILNVNMRVSVSFMKTP